VPSDVGLGGFFQDPHSGSPWVTLLACDGSDIARKQGVNLAGSLRIEGHPIIVTEGHAMRGMGLLPNELQTFFFTYGRQQCFIQLFQCTALVLCRTWNVNSTVMLRSLP